MRDVERYLDAMTIFNERMRTQLLGDPNLADQDAYLRDVFEHGPRDMVDRMMRTDTLTYLPEDVLVKVDRSTMAELSRGPRPLLDHRLVEFAARLPTGRKLRFATLKRLFREIAGELLPAELLEQPKYGFTVPLAEWFRCWPGGPFSRDGAGAGCAKQ